LHIRLKNCLLKQGKTKTRYIFVSLNKNSKKHEEAEEKLMGIPVTPGWKALE